MARRAKNYSEIFEIIRDDLAKYVDEVDDELAKAVVNQAVKLIRADVRKYVHNPTQWTLRGIQPALQGEYGIRVRNNVAAVLRNVVEGLPANGPVPNLSAPDINIDFHGNEPRGQFRRLSRRKDNFRINTETNGIEPGIYRRLGKGKMRRLYRFAKNEQRKARLPYEQVANEALEVAFNQAAETIIENINFDQALIDAIRLDFNIKIPKTSN
jgi:hypothetical protein